MTGDNSNVMWAKLELPPEHYLFAVECLRNPGVMRLDVVCPACRNHTIPGRVIATHPESCSVTVLHGWDGEGEHIEV